MNGSELRDTHKLEGWLRTGGVHLVGARSRRGLGGFDDAVRNVCTLLEKRQGDVSAAEMEQIIGRKERQARKIFHRIARESFRLAQLRARLNPSRALVRDTSKAIADIAGRLGYSRRAKFDQSYRSVYGITPAADRAAYRNSEFWSAAQGVDKARKIG